MTLAFWVVFVAFVGAFAVQVATRVRLIAAAPGEFALDDMGGRIQRFLVDVVFQVQTIRERPIVGLAHAFVFWGFVAFGGYTTVEFLHGLGIADLTETRWFFAYRIVLVPFATMVLGGILFLLVRRAVFRPAALGSAVSIESIVIALFIATLMATFLLAFNLDETTVGGRVNWWVSPPRSTCISCCRPSRSSCDRRSLAGFRTWISKRKRSGSRPSRISGRRRCSTLSHASNAGVAR